MRFVIPAIALWSLLAGCCLANTFQDSPATNAPQNGQAETQESAADGEGGTANSEVPTEEKADPARPPQPPLVNPATQPQTSPPETPVSPPAAVKVTEADRVLQLQARIEQNTTRLETVEADLEKATDRFESEGKEYNSLRTQFDELAKRAKELRDSGKLEEAMAAEKDMASLELQLNLAKEQVDLALKNQKLMQEQVNVLQTTLTQDQAALERLKNPPAEETPATAPQVVDPAEPATTPPTAPGAPLGIAPAAADSPAHATTGETSDPAAVPKAPTPEPVSKKTAEAQQKAEEKQREVQQLENALEDVAERKNTLVKAIELEKQRIQTARQRQESLDEALRVLEDQFNEKLAANAPQSELQELRQKIQEREKNLREVRTEIGGAIEHYQQLRSNLLDLQNEELQTARDAVEKRREADVAKRNEWLVRLQETARIKGPQAGLVLLGMIALWWISAVTSRRIVGLLVRAGRGTVDERKNRASTLVSVFHNAANLVIIIGGGIMLLDLLGMPVQPLLGGAAVIGLAVAFGAQNLIRDYFYGFIILLENQYKLNDVITIGDKTGVVERITLRITVLRDLEGRAHFVPNGEITSVTNRTLGWAQAVFEIGVAYKESVDQVMEVLLDIARELREDPDFKDSILDDAQMLGVDSFGDSSVNIKFLMKTRSDQRYPVQREMMRRIKNRFDELGIEIPFPHRTVFVHNEPEACKEFNRLSPTQPDRRPDDGTA